ncbi:hypothetical protein ACFLXI_03875 [Chloroflexota bacterium]
MNKLSNLQAKLPAWMKSDFFLSLIIFLLWLLSAAFSFYVMVEFQHMILRRYVANFPDARWDFQILRQWSTIFMVGVWLAFVIITGEYHYQHQREEVSWKVFRRSFVGLLIVLAIALIL